MMDSSDDVIVNVSLYTNLRLNVPLIILNLTLFEVSN